MDIVNQCVYITIVGESVELTYRHEANRRGSDKEPTESEEFTSDGDGATTDLEENGNESDDEGEIKDTIMHKI